MSEIAEESTPQKASPKSPWRFAPLVLIVAGFAAFFVFGLNEHVSFDSLREHRQWLVETVAKYHLVTAAVFVAIYALSVVFFLPIATIVSLAGGFLFGPILGTIYIVIAATLGGTGAFLATKTAFEDILREKAGPWLGRLREGFHDNEMNYLLFLRLVPVFPFFVINIVPAFLGVSLRTFVIATFFGIIPGSAVYAFLGAGLGELLASDAEFTVEGLISPELLVGLAGLAVLSLAPVVLKKFGAKSVDR
ncbi:TVP38/TMEM64 family protein [Hwanghaeella grinnelliae]|nr:TVP38/TMEM64 family protein [Hwanghaeella grinnelliae]